MITSATYSLSASISKIQICGSKLLHVLPLFKVWNSIIRLVPYNTNSKYSFTVKILGPARFPVHVPSSLEILLDWFPSSRQSFQSLYIQVSFLVCLNPCSGRFRTFVPFWYFAAIGISAIHINPLLKF